MLRMFKKLVYLLLPLLKVLFNQYQILCSKYYKLLVILKCHSYQEPLRVNFRTKVTKNTYLGKNVNFNGLTILGGGEVRIGNNFHSGPGCLLITAYHNYDKGDAIPYDNTYIYKKIIIENNVWLGANVTILGGTIGEGAIIQAGSIIVKDVPKYAIVGNPPATVFKLRNIEHYEKLKEAKKFS